MEETSIELVKDNIDVEISLMIRRIIRSLSMQAGRIKHVSFTVFKQRRFAHDFVRIVEVGPRDGLQNEATKVSTQDKAALVRMLGDAGCSFIEAGAFVSPKWVPQMADSFEVMEALRDWRVSKKDVVLSCLTPNLVGFEQAVKARADEIAIFASASEAFSKKNINASIDESFERFKIISVEAQRLHMPVRGYISCVVGCPYQGRVLPSEVANTVQKMMSLGVREISLGDTIGTGTVTSTSDMIDAVQAVVTGTETTLAVHFHDTYGQALPNILKSIDKGIRVVDSSVAGLGGCPYAKGASGNVATEDVVYMLNGMGLDTGIDLDKLVLAGDLICKVLGRESQSKVARVMLAQTNARQ